jgi:hypothetical protein
MIPAVEGLLPEPYNSMIMTLLFHLAEWHAFGKLRMHTEHTLGLLTQSMTTIGKELRSFAEWTQVFKTVELPGETDTRDRRRRRRKPPLAGTASNAANPPLAPSAGSEPRQTEPSAQLKAKPKRKTFNLFTYKLHALGDYARTIRLFGTTDSYSTQIVRSQT